MYTKRVIAPYKGELEMWYQNNYSFILDFKLILLTAWVILFPSQCCIKNGLKIYQSEILINKSFHFI